MADFNEIDEVRRLLKLPEAATLKEIRSAYRRMAHRYHPDKHQGTSGDQVEKMKRLNRAYKVLLDYCNAYKYGFLEEDVARTYPFEENLGKWRDKWFDSI